MIKERGRNEPRLLHTAVFFSCHCVPTSCLFQRTFSTMYVLTALLGKTRGPFLEGPENFLHPESHSKISHLMITELCYSYIFKMNRSSLHARRFGRVRFSTFRYRYQNGFTARNVSGAFEKRAPGYCPPAMKCH